MIRCAIGPQINHEARIHHDKSTLIALVSELVVLALLKEPVMRLVSLTPRGATRSRAR